MQLGFLRTRVGRRFLVSNLLAALLPLTVVAVVPYRYVRAELRDMAEARVSRLSKSLAFSTLSALATASHDAGNDLRREGDAIEPAFTSTALPGATPPRACRWRSTTARGCAR
ncbi:MAG: hypothetical protein IPN47_10520 [Gemmatimonadetes bacterium]|nr:hypothetical protein [Gemmatimonadota bacterium]